jgi:hypothetical protein
MIDRGDWNVSSSYEGNVSKGRFMFFVAVVLLTYVWLPTDIDFFRKWEGSVNQKIEMVGILILLLQSGLFGLMWWRGSQFARKLLFALTLFVSFVFALGACAVFYAYMTGGLARQSAVVSEILLHQVVFISTTVCISLIGAGILMLKQVVAFVSFRSGIRRA